MTITITSSGVIYSDGNSQDRDPAYTVAAQSAGNVGTYGFFYYPGAQIRYTGTAPGSALYCANAGTFGPNNRGYYNQTVAGSWRCMGDCGSANGGTVPGEDCKNTLWVRYA